jgi:hypothetical protein
MSAFEQGKFIWLDHVYGWQDILVKENLSNIYLYCHTQQGNMVLK